MPEHPIKVVTPQKMVTYEEVATDIARALLDRMNARKDPVQHAVITVFGLEDEPDAIDQAGLIMQALDMVEDDLPGRAGPSDGEAGVVVLRPTLEDGFGEWVHVLAFLPRTAMALTLNGTGAQWHVLGRPCKDTALLLGDVTDLDFLLKTEAVPSSHPRHMATFVDEGARRAFPAVVTCATEETSAKWLIKGADEEEEALVKSLAQAASTVHTLVMACISGFAEQGSWVLEPDIGPPDPDGYESISLVARNKDTDFAMKFAVTAEGAISLGSLQEPVTDAEKRLAAMASMHTAWETEGEEDVEMRSPMAAKVGEA